MKLKQIHADSDRDQSIAKDIELLLQTLSNQDERPCSGCDKVCTSCGSPTCTCMCNSDCEHAAEVMSSFPVRYPIEEKIVPLVFAFNCLKVCPPYWSCEGHMSPRGDIFKVPQVWFFSKSIIYPKMIGDYVIELKASKAIQYPWHICLTYAENSIEPGFSIEPDFKSIENPDLQIMQDDAKIISDSMLEGLRNLAVSYRKKYLPANASRSSL